MYVFQSFFNDNCITFGFTKILKMNLKIKIIIDIHFLLNKKNHIEIITN